MFAPHQDRIPLPSRQAPRAQLWHQTAVEQLASPAQLPLPVPMPQGLVGRRLTSRLERLVARPRAARPAALVA